MSIKFETNQMKTLNEHFNICLGSLVTAIAFAVIYLFFHLSGNAHIFDPYFVSGGIATVQAISMLDIKRKFKNEQIPTP